MHVQCNACGARYVIADEKIPVQGARVRCRKCQAVFQVERGAQAPATPEPAPLPLIPPTPQEPAPSSRSASPPVAAPAEPAPSDRLVLESSAPKAGEPAEGVAPTEIERFATAFASSAQAVEKPPAPPSAPSSPEPAPNPSPFPSAPALAAEPPAASSAGAGSSAGIPEGLPEQERLKHERARRLARVLASDIAIYNKEKRDRGIKDGNLVAVLGYEIKKSWEVYKERVTPEMANSTPYFRDALNEMLAEGKKVF